MVKRKLYLKRILPFVDKPLIKIITGIHRSGKSVLLRQIKDEIHRHGIPEKRLIYINFESFAYANLNTAAKLYEFIRSRIETDERYYLFFDEIQEVSGWEKAVNGLRVDFNTDIYITGSNSKIFSSELATLLTGRYVQFEIYTLSFSEYLEFRRTYFKETGEKHDEFARYLRFGGFPVIHTAEYDPDDAYKIIFDIYSSIVLRDVVQRHRIRNVELLKRIIRFVFDNTGSPFSAKKIADYFKSQFRKVDLSTVYNYLHALETSYMVHRIARYDLQGKEMLKTLEKYFAGDHGFIYALLGIKDRLISGVLENIVMLELKRRGYRVFTGKWRDKEIDFVAEKQNKKLYIQVAYSIAAAETRERELYPLRKIKDNYPKYVLSMDPLWQDHFEGIIHRHIADFLLDEDD